MLSRLNLLNCLFTLLSRSHTVHCPATMKVAALFSLALPGMVSAAQSGTSTQQLQNDKATVSLSPSASVVGNSVNSGGVDFFSGIRYAQPQ